MLKTIFLIGLLFSIIVISGCLASSDTYANPQYENRELPTSNPISVSTYQSSQNPAVPEAVSGNNQVLDVSGDTIIVSGLSNQVRVINADVSKIVISGNDNLIYYPKDANPEIINSGLRNVIKTY